MEVYLLALILLSAGAGFGFAAGHLTVRFNHLLVILLGRAWKSGHARKRYPVIGAITTLFFTCLIFILIDSGLEIKIISTILFATLFAAGIKNAERRFKNSLDIMDRIVRLMFQTSHPQPSSGELDNSIEKDVSRISRGILKSMPESNVEALKMLFLFFDSTTAVFLISLTNGRFRVRRFLHLKKAEQLDYLETWNKNPYLFYAIQGIKSLINFSYYTSRLVWDEIGYNGEALRGSYLK
ncbi:MAG TPA: hypothetical protein VLD38_05695 [Nitrosopumilaceae archaeon]|nr:hypothetical protein [Nitrosopumilaceae archaeon]